MYESKSIMQRGKSKSEQLCLPYSRSTSYDHQVWCLLEWPTRHVIYLMVYRLTNPRTNKSCLPSVTIRQVGVMTLMRRSDYGISTNIAICWTVSQRSISPAAYIPWMVSDWRLCMRPALAKNRIVSKFDGLTRQFQSDSNVKADELVGMR